MKKFYDVVISGAGISGVALAALLKSSPYFKSRSVLLLDKSMPAVKPRLKVAAKESGSVPFSNRIYALNQSSLDVLKFTGAWEIICDDYRHWPAFNMQTLDSRCRKGFTTFSNADPNEPVAHFLESQVIVSSLLRSVQSTSNNPIIMSQNQISKLERNPNSVKVGLENGEEVETLLLVGAEGFNSNVRKLSGIKWYQHLYHHHALVGTLKVECPDGNRTAWQRFLDSGPIASLPLERDTASLVLFASKIFLDQLILRPDQEIVDSLNRFWTEDVEMDSFEYLSRFQENVQNIFGGVGSLSSRGEEPRPPLIKSVDKMSLATFPVGFGHAVNYVKPNVALVGDAAHRIHPLAGQGANLSLSDCKVLFEQMQSAVEVGENPGKFSYLLEYERKAQAHNVPTQLFCDIIYRLYGSSRYPAVLLRSLAAASVNNLAAVNSMMVKWASTSKPLQT